MLTTSSPSVKVALQSAVTSELKPLPIIEASPASLITGSNGTHRYHFGWSDPRGVYQDYSARRFEHLPMMLTAPNFATDMTDEQLRAAWIIYFGTGELRFEDMQKRDPDEFSVAIECWRRGIIGRLIKHNWETELYGLKDGYR